MKNKHLVVYLGMGIWKDSEGKMWGNSTSNTEIVTSRTFEDELTGKEFLESRSDIKFMVGYGQMKIDSIEKEVTPIVEPIVETKVETVVEPKVEVIVIEEKKVAQAPTINISTKK